MRRSSLFGEAGVAGAAALLAGPALGQSTPPIAEYFGFEDERIIVVDNGAGPIATGDFNADRRPDLAIVNNRKSRIEVHSLRLRERTTEQIERDYEVNELPPNAWYDRTELIVRDRIEGLASSDFDGDGRQDLVALSASPSGIVSFHQHVPGEFKEASREDLVGLNASQDAFVLADLDGDGRDELAAIVSGKVRIWEIGRDGRFGDATMLGSGEDLRQLLHGDFDGDGQTDLLGIAPGTETPLRLWLHAGGSVGTLPTLAMRFGVPNVLNGGVIRTGAGVADQICAIENGTRRQLVYELAPSESDETRVARLIPLEGESDGQPIVIADLDRDGFKDVLSLDADANETVVLWQLADAGLALRTKHPTFKTPSGIAVGSWGGRDDPAVFVLSEQESAVGVSWFDESRGVLEFPAPIVLSTSGGTPVAMRAVEIDGESVLMVIVKKRRDFVLEAHRWTDEGGEVSTIELDGVTRAPGSILAFDADRDETTDLLLLTPGDSMLMVLGETEDGTWSPSEVRDEDSMRQFGLVQAAGVGNTVIQDLDGDGKPELVIGDDNFVRACVYGEEQGWRVIEQFNLDSDAQVTSLALQGNRLLVGESGRDRIVVLDREGGSWTKGEELEVEGVAIGAMHAGSFAGDGSASALIVDGANLAMVTLDEPGQTLSVASVHRPDEDNRFEHRITAGDINSDGYTDLIVLDAREQMCSLLSIAASGRIVPAMEFKVFESRLFSRGESMEFQPSLAVATDLTGDARDDLLLLVHDRVIVYPQSMGR